MERLVTGSGQSLLDVGWSMRKPQVCAKRNPEKLPFLSGEPSRLSTAFRPAKLPLDSNQANQTTHHRTNGFDSLVRPHHKPPLSHFSPVRWSEFGQAIHPPQRTHHKLFILIQPLE